MSRAGAAVVLVIVVATPGFAWRADLRGGALVSQDAAQAVAILPGGDAVVVGELDCDSTALRIDRATGEVVWRAELATAPSFCPAGQFDYAGPPPPVAVESDDAVILAARGIVVKLDAATGVERWRHEVEGYGFGVGLNSIVLDRAGGVLVAGAINGSDSEPEFDFLVASLDGATGVERWRQVRNGTPGPLDPDDDYWNDTWDGATAVAIDAAGNAVVVGEIEHRGRPRTFLFQFAADSGAVRWTRRIRRQGVQLLAADHVADEVVLAGWRDDGRGLGVQRYDAGSGARRWRKRVHGPVPDGLFGYPRDLVIAPDGDAYILTMLPDGASGYAAAVVRLAAARGAISWVQSLRLGGDVFRDWLDLALDGTGNPVLAGRLAEDPDTAMPVVVGLEAEHGTVRWRFAPSSVPPGESAIRAVAAGGDVFAVGLVRGADANVLAARIATLDGSVGWERSIDGGATDGDDAAFAVATLPGGDLVAAGGLDNGSTGSDFAVVRLAGDSGAVRWRAELNGMRAGVFDYAYDEARRVAVDPHGDVVAAGLMEQPSTEWDLAVVKLDGTTGAERWRALVSGTAEDGRDVATDVTTDAAGDVVVVGYLWNRYGSTYGPDFFVRKLDSATGAERWRRIVPLSYGQPFQVAVDPSGDVVVAGVASTPGTGGDFVVVKLAGDTGADLWRANLNGTEGVFEGAHALALTAEGDVLAAGTLSNLGSGSDWTVVRLAGDSGAERWRHAFDGPFHGADTAEALALDDAGDVLVAGTAQVAAELWDVVLQKLDGPSGTERWRRTVTTDAWPVPPFVALAGAANGDALLLASPTSGPGDRDLVIVRAAGDDGGERWRRVVTGTAPGSDYGSAIVERADGTVAVAARTINAGSGPDFTVVTIAGADGGDPAPAP